VRARPTAILVRIGLNTGIGIVEKHDIFGDVVNVASRIETEAGPQRSIFRKPVLKRWRMPGILLQVHKDDGSQE